MGVNSVAASELYRGDSSSMAPSVFENSYWDNGSSAGSQYHPYGKLASNMRDRKPSEVGNYDLTRVAEEVEEGTLNTGRDNSSELKRRIPVVSLGQGKWPDDFVDAFKPPTPSRAINNIGAISRSQYGQALRITCHLGSLPT